MTCWTMAVSTRCPPTKGVRANRLEEACPFRLRAHKDYILWADDVRPRQMDPRLQQQGLSSAHRHRWI